MMIIRFKLLDGARTPEKNFNAAGYDLFAYEEKVLSPNEKITIRTGVKIQMPDGFFAQIVGRSGLSAKTPLNCITGTIDNDYRGELNIILHNTSLKEHYHVKKGQKIAQLVLFYQPVTRVMLVSELDDTQRGEKGFGSSGV